MNTALPAAQDALGLLLAADSTIGKSWKGVGSPLQLETFLDAVWISGEVDEWTQNYSISNLGQKDENFTIRIHCLKTKEGNFVSARDACVTLATQVENVIKNNQIDLTGSVKLLKIGAGAMEESRLDERRHQVLITLFVQCEAWLSE